MFRESDLRLMMEWRWYQTVWTYLSKMCLHWFISNSPLDSETSLNVIPCKIDGLFVQNGACLSLPAVNSPSICPKTLSFQIYCWLPFAKLLLQFLELAVLRQFEYMEKCSVSTHSLGSFLHLINWARKPCLLKHIRNLVSGASLGFRVVEIFFSSGGYLP